MSEIMWRKIWQIIDERLVKPFRESHAPADHLALGSAVGVFWALTPLVGIQMYLVSMTWAVGKFFKIRMSLPIGMAMVWISNPLTMPALYYIFYITGYYIFILFGAEMTEMSFQSFSQVIDEALSMSLVDSLIYWGKFLLNDFGLPALIGGFVTGIPGGIFAYRFTMKWVARHRTKLAKKEGLTLEQWEARHVHSFMEVLQEQKEERLHAKEAESTGDKVTTRH